MGGAAPRPRRERPRAVWFFVGGALMVLAPLLFVGALFTVLRPLTQEDAVFGADGGPVQVSLPAGQERAVFTTTDSGVHCSATDGSGERVAFRSVTGEFTFNEWTALARFDTGDGDLTFTCADEIGTGGDVRIAQLPSGGSLVTAVVIGIIGPLLLGTLGFIVLVVTAVLYATRAPRARSGTG